MSSIGELGLQFDDHVHVSGIQSSLKIQQKNSTTENIIDLQQKRCEEKSTETMIDLNLQHKRCEEKGAEQAQALNMIPCLPDHITVTQIFTRLPWTRLWNLSIMGQAWRWAFESRYSYDFRAPLAKCEREAFLTVIHRHPICPVGLYPFPLRGENDDLPYQRGEEYAISLYDTHRNLWNLLPDLPQGTRGRSIPYECAWVILDSRLYILGGEDESGKTRADVYMMDFAACRRVWQTCTSMSQPRSKFACHAVDGKIYVMGGSFAGGFFSPFHNYSKEAEVYDPKENLWSPIAKMVHHHMYHSALVLQGELYVHGGIASYSKMSPDGFEESHGPPNFAESYNPNTNKWKKIDNFERTGLELSLEYALVVVNEHLYKLKAGLKISLYDVHSNSWTDQEIDIYLPNDMVLFDNDLQYNAAVAIGGEVFVQLTAANDLGDLNGNCILKSIGFSSNEGYIVWEEVSCPHLFGSDFHLLQAFQI